MLPYGAEWFYTPRDVEGATVTVEGDYKHPPLYEEEEMFLDISFVKESDALGHYKKYIDYKQSNY